MLPAETSARTCGRADGQRNGGLASYVSIDGAISVGDPDDKWKLSLVGVNLTDEIWTNTSGGRPFLQPGVGDDLVVTQNRGRQVFVEASFKF